MWVRHLQLVNATDWVFQHSLRTKAVLISFSMLISGLSVTCTLVFSSRARRDRQRRRQEECSSACWQCDLTLMVTGPRRVSRRWLVFFLLFQAVCEDLLFIPMERLWGPKFQTQMLILVKKTLLLYVSMENQGLQKCFADKKSTGSKEQMEKERKIDLNLLVITPWWSLKDKIRSCFERFCSRTHIRFTKWKAVEFVQSTHHLWISPSLKSYSHRHPMCSLSSYLPQEQEDLAGERRLKSTCPYPLIQTPTPPAWLP